VDLKLVFAPGVIGGWAFVGAWAGEGDKLMAPLVHHKTADLEGLIKKTGSKWNSLALESLLPETPDEVGAVAAEGGLLEEAGGEFVVLHLVHVLLPEGAFAGEAHGALLALARRRPRSRVSHLARGEREPKGAGPGAAGPRAAGPGSARGGGRCCRPGPRERWAVPGAIRPRLVSDPA